MSIFEYTDQNYLTFGYNGKPFNHRQTPTDVFQVTYQSIRRPAETFDRELIAAAQLVSKKTKKPIWVCFSGGMDSEVTLRAFLLAGLPVQVAIVRMIPDQNDHDIKYAFKFCQQNNVPHRVFDLEIASFLQNHLPDYDYLQCCSPQFAPVLWLMERIIELGGCPVIGSGDTCLVRQENTNDFFFVEREKYFSYHGLLLHHRAEGVPAFLQYTPELFLSFLKSKQLGFYIASECRRLKILSISKYKHKIYSEFLQMEDRPVYNGFEKLTELDAKYRALLKARFPGSDCEIRIPYPALLEILEP